MKDAKLDFEFRFDLEAQLPDVGNLYDIHLLVSNNIWNSLKTTMRSIEAAMYNEIY